jgi:hypothetical protein
MSYAIALLGAGYDAQLRVGECRRLYLVARVPTQKPAAHFCGRVLGGAIHFGQNTMFDRTSQENF